MEQYQANRILNSALASLRLEDASIPKGAKKDALMFLMHPETLSSTLTKAYNSRHKQGFCLLLRIIQLLSEQPTKNFKLETLLYVHETLFCDFKSDCGILRRNNMQKDGCEFLDFRHLPFSLNSIIKQMDSIWGYNRPTRDDFAASLAHLFRELTILSPFPYGNGITTRVFLEKFAISNGFTLDYQLIIKDYDRAIDEAFKFDNIRPLYKSLLRGLSYSITPTFVETVPLPNGALLALPPPSISQIPQNADALYYPTITIEPNLNQTHFTPTQSLKHEHSPFKKSKRSKKPAVIKAPPTPKKSPSTRISASTKRKRP